MTIFDFFVAITLDLRINIDDLFICIACVLLEFVWDFFGILMLIFLVLYCI